MTSRGRGREAARAGGGCVPRCASSASSSRSPHCRLLLGVRRRTSPPSANWQDIATDVAMVVVVAVGETMVVLTRNIDLSVGSVVGLAGIRLVAARSRTTTALRSYVVALIALGVGLVCGLGNGLLVADRQDSGDHRDAGDARDLPRHPLRDHERPERPGVAPAEALPATLPRRRRRPASRRSPGSRSASPSSARRCCAGLRGRATSTRSAPTPTLRGFAGNPDGAARDDGVRAQRAPWRAWAASCSRRGSPTRRRDRRATGFEFDVVTAVVIGGVNVFGGSGHRPRRDARRAARRDDRQRLHAAAHLASSGRSSSRALAIVVAVTIDALFTQRLQEALRRRRRPALLAARGEGTEA